MKNLRRYLKAFWVALRMTARGQTYHPPPTPSSPLTAWINQYAILLTAVLRAADQNGLNQTVRKQIKLRLDGRLTDLETALTTLQFHATQEHPSLLRAGTGRGVESTIYATNMNDRYWVSRMAEAPELQKPDLQKALADLNAHLDAIPRLDEYHLSPRLKKN